MSTEKSFWEYLKRNFAKNEIHARRLECSYAGIPDVLYKIKLRKLWIHGWIELKYIRAYPKNMNLLIKLGHFTKWQKAFLRNEGSSGVPAWLFLKVENDYFLMHWSEAVHINEISYLELPKRASYASNRRVVFSNLRKILKNEVFCRSKETLCVDLNNKNTEDRIFS